MTERPGAEAHERGEKRLGYRNGHWERVFTARLGDLELLVPQQRGWTFPTAIFESYLGSEKALCILLVEM